MGAQCLPPPTLPPRPSPPSPPTTTHGFPVPYAHSLVCAGPVKSPLFYAGAAPQLTATRVTAASPFQELPRVYSKLQPEQSQPASER